MEAVGRNDKLREPWDARLDAFTASGLSVSRWCREHDVPEHQLRYWLKKRTSSRRSSIKTHDTGWVALQTMGQPLMPGISLRIGPISVDIQQGFDATVLVDVIRTLLQEC